jgi:hypothetical protein
MAAGAFYYAYLSRCRKEGAIACGKGWFGEQRLAYKDDTPIKFWVTVGVYSSVAIAAFAFGLLVLLKIVSPLPLNGYFSSK